MEGKDAAKGFGSIWNNNSWFYEEKNFTKFAKDYLNDRIPKIFVTKNDMTVRLYEIKEVEGQASNTLRKQKQIERERGRRGMSDGARGCVRGGRRDTTRQE